MFSMLISCKSPEPEIYLIPKNYTGRIIILLNQKLGEEKEHEGEFRVYRIPISGILKTKYSSNTGEFDLDKMKFYFDDSNSRSEIPDFNIKRDSTYINSQIFYYSNGIMEDRDIKYIEFIVAPYSKRDSFFIKNEQGVLIEDKSFWKKVDSEIEN